VRFLLGRAKAHPNKLVDQTFELAGPAHEEREPALCWIPNDWRRYENLPSFHHETENLSGALANCSWSYIVEPGTSSTELTRRENALAENSSVLRFDARPSSIRCRQSG
jgi:hypothetical protein